MPKQIFTNVDFDDIVSNLIGFLQGQSQFQDYDFDGSGLRTLIDLLAHNTEHQIFYLNQVGSEMFLDSAILRASVVSRAKHLGYMPRTVRSSRAYVDVQIFPEDGPGDTSPDFIILERSTQFKALVDRVSYNFSPTKNIIIQPVNGVYKASNVELVEGQRLTHRFTVDTSQLTKQRFIIPNKNVDETTLIVKVQVSESNTTQNLYTRHQDLNEITGDDRVYFLQENDGKIELTFGDGVVGKALNDGNIIIVEYVVSNGDSVRGSRVFTATTIGGYSNIKVTTVAAASRSTPQESIESIKQLAPLNYEAQNRAVTKLDYETLIKKDVEEAEFVRVWGGEEADPPEYGKVFVAIKPFDAFQLTTEKKEEILEQDIRPRNMISVEAIIVDPILLRLKIATTVSVDLRKTSSSPDDIEAAVLDAIENFKDENLSGFGADFRHSKFVQAINNADDSIISNLSNVEMVSRINPPFNVPTRLEINFQNKLDTADSANKEYSIVSTGFIFRGIETFITDNGQGRLDYFRVVNDKKVIIKEDIGTVNYEKGVLTIPDFLIEGLPNEVDFVDIIAKPDKLDVEAVREQIILLENDDLTVVIENVSE